VRSQNLGPALGLKRLYFKYEGLNPTGSFKDRGMVVAVAKALEERARVLVCASTGNTSASAAAYAPQRTLAAYAFARFEQLPQGARIANAMRTHADLVGGPDVRDAGAREPKHVAQVDRAERRLAGNQHELSAFL